MPKLSENQTAGVDALNSALKQHGVSAIDKAAWKKAAPDGVSINTASLLKTGAVVSERVQISGRTVEIFSPTRPTAEVGG
jgi:hypothetical protein